MVKGGRCIDGTVTVYVHDFSSGMKNEAMEQHREETSESLTINKYVTLNIRTL